MSSLSSLSQNLIAAREERKALADFPGSLPDGPAEAYAIQSECIAGWVDTLVGWKVAGLKADLHEEFKAKRQSGPVFKNNLFTNDGSQSTQVPVFPEGSSAVEAEFVILLGDVTHLPTSNLTEQDVISVIEKVYIGVEIAGSSIHQVHSHGTLAGICDFGNNAGVIIGPEVENWQKVGLSNINVNVKLDGEEVGSANAKPSLDGPLGALTYLFEHLAQRSHKVEKGMYVSSGAITGAHRAGAGANSEVSFKGIGTINLKLVANNQQYNSNQ